MYYDVRDARISPRTRVRRRLEIDLREKMYACVSPSGTGFRISPRRYLYAKRINPMIIYRRVHNAMLIKQ